MVVNILHDEIIVITQLHGIADSFDDSLDTALLFKFVALFYKAFPLKEVNDNIVEIKHDKLKAVCSFCILVLHI